MQDISVVGGVCGVVDVGEWWFFFIEGTGGGVVGSVFIKGGVKSVFEGLLDKNQINTKINFKHQIT